MLACKVTPSPSIAAGIPVAIPKSERLTIPEMLKPASVFLLIGFSTVPLNTTSNTTGLVTPCNVRLPANLYFLSPTFLKEVLLKVRVGNFSASKKSALFR